MHVFKLGDYWIGPRIASGARGHVFYASPLGAGALPTVAIKYPSTKRELRVLKALHAAPEPCLGVPLLLASGVHEGKTWLVMELLSKLSFKDILRRIARLPPHRRWPLVQVIGRLLLRRLRAMHERGFVHCDIHPSNIIFGRKKYGCPAERCLPFFVDFGLAHPHPDGEPIAPHAGTITYTSIRSADGGVRLPRDDVEALGWMLCHAVLGSLPWLPMIEKVSWKDKPRRAALCKRVQQEKARVLEEGMEYSLERRWNTPPELAAYLRLCRTFGADDDRGEAARPDYDGLAALLGEVDEAQCTPRSSSPSPEGGETLFDFDELPEVPGLEEGLDLFQQLLAEI